MTDSLTRSVSFNLTDTQEDGDGLTLEGYAAVFESPTRINDWEGEFEETIERGAFAKTIAESTPVLQFDHGSHPLLGSIPIGAIKSLREDARGLFVRARLTDNWLVAPVRDAIRDGAITGMSFRFAPVRQEWNEDRTVRRIKELRLFELGPVVWPAYTETEVGVRSLEVRSKVEHILQDEACRSELARALTFGESNEVSRSADAAIAGTSADDQSEPPVDGTRDGVTAAPVTEDQPARNLSSEFVQFGRDIDLYLKEFQA